MKRGDRVFHRQFLGTGTVTERKPSTILGNVPVQWDEDYSWLTKNNSMGVAPYKVQEIPRSGVPSRPVWWTQEECDALCRRNA